MAPGAANLGPREKRLRSVGILWLPFGVAPMDLFDLLLRELSFSTAVLLFPVATALHVLEEQLGSVQGESAVFAVGGTGPTASLTEGAMTRRMVLRVVFHGALLVVLGMLVGFAFHHAITAGSEPDTQRAWRVAHTSLVGGGVLYLAFAAVAQYLLLSPRVAAFAVWSLVVAAYAFAFGFVVGPAVGARGLEAIGPPLHVLVFGVLAVGLSLLLIAGCIVLWGSYAAMRALPRTE